MPTLGEQIKAVEEEIQRTPYNKASQHHIGKLKAKLARLREALEKGPGRGKGVGKFSVKKEGDATVALIGFPSVGKSTLINRLANTDSRVASFDFTTLSAIPGLMEYGGAKIQILDIPGLISGASKGRGRGREVLAIARISDLLLIMVDAFQIDQLNIIEKELRDAGIRINQKKPDVTMRRKDRGGLTLSSTMKAPGISAEEIRGVINAHGIFNAEVTLREKISVEDFIDVMTGNRVYLPAVIAINKIDIVSDEEIREYEKKGFVPISAKDDINLEKLREKIFSKLELMRIYMKPQGKQADMQKPLIIKKGATVSDVCDKLHRDIRKKFRYACITGRSVKFKEEKVGLKHVLNDGDIVTIIKRF